jgi:hypothetical protein
MNEESSFDNLQNTQVASLSALQNQAKAKRAKEIERHPELANIKDRANFENLLTICEMEKNSILYGATEIFFYNFKSFFLNGLAVLGLFFATTFLLSNFETSLGTYATAVYGVTMWIFFCYLRVVFLTIVANYFLLKGSPKPMLYGLYKLTGFMLVEVLQIIIFLFDAALIVLIPYSCRNSLALPILVAQNETAINSLLTSHEYVRGNLRKNFFLVLFGNFSTFSAFVLLIIGGSFLIKNTLIFWSAVLAVASFTTLPVQVSYRFLLYKKLQKISGGQINVSITLFEKIKFIFWRIFSLAFLATILVLFHQKIIDWIASWLMTAKNLIG